MLVWFQRIKRPQFVRKTLLELASKPLYIFLFHRLRENETLIRYHTNKIKYITFTNLQLMEHINICPHLCLRSNRNLDIIESLQNKEVHNWDCDAPHYLKLKSIFNIQSMTTSGLFAIFLSHKHGIIPRRVGTRILSYDKNVVRPNIRGRANRHRGRPPVAIILN